MDIWMDVDAAITVPVNLMPLLDDADFKTRETGVAYNAGGMDLVWNFVKTDGTITQTAVTPTDTGGNYDWTHVGDGIYKIEIPASGGASINNDQEGFGWFTGIATGVLPWRGPVIGFRAAAVNNDLIDAGESLAKSAALGTVDDLVDDLESRLSAARAGYLDNLSGGAVATAASVAAVNGLVDDLESRLTALRAGYLDNLSGGPAALEATLAVVDALIDAIKTKTDQLAFTEPNQVDANALSGGGSGLDAAGVRAALGMAAANLDEQFEGIPDAVHDDLAAIPAVNLALPVMGDPIEVYAGDTVEFDISGLGSLASVDDIYFTVKRDINDTDANSIWKVSRDSGLLVLNQAAAAVPANSTITVTDESTGAIHVLLKAVESIKIPCRSYVFDVRALTDPDEAVTLAQGEINFHPVVTKEI